MIHIPRTIASFGAASLFAGLVSASVQAQSPVAAAASPTAAASAPAATAPGNTAPASTAAPYFAEKSANVFRRFSGDGVKTLEFYGQVLGFGDIGAVGGVSRYQVGPSQLKFTKASANAKFTRGAINDAAGVRLWTMWFPDEAVLTKRFADHGFAAPAFKTIDGMRSALVADPDGEWVQLVIAPNAAEGSVRPSRDRHRGQRSREEPRVLSHASSVSKNCRR